MVTYDFTDGSNVHFTANSLRNTTFIGTRRGVDHTLELAFNNVLDYTEARSFVEYAGAVQTGTTLGGVPWYLETLASDATVNSLVVLVDPQETSTLINPFWCVITGAEDMTASPGVDYRLDLDVFYLAPGDDFTARDDVEDSLGVSITG